MLDQPSLNERSPREFMGSAQKGTAQGDGGMVWPSPSLPEPGGESAPTASPHGWSERSNHRGVLLGGRYEEQVPRPDAPRWQDCRRSTCPGQCLGDADVDTMVWMIELRVVGKKR